MCLHLRTREATSCSRGGLLFAPFLRGGGTSPLFSAPGGGVRPPFFRARSARKKGTFGAEGAFLENFYDFFEKFVNKNAIKMTFSKKWGSKIFLKKWPPESRKKHLKIAKFFRSPPLCVDKTEKFWLQGGYVPPFFGSRGGVRPPFFKTRTRPLPPCSGYIQNIKWL